MGDRLATAASALPGGGERGRGASPPGAGPGPITLPGLSGWFSGSSWGLRPPSGARLPATFQAWLWAGSSCSLLSWSGFLEKQPESAGLCSCCGGPGASPSPACLPGRAGGAPGPGSRWTPFYWGFRSR